MGGHSRNWGEVMDLKDRLKEHEGFEAEIYRCSAGHWTIGFGHKINAHCRISPQVADLLLDEDIHLAELRYLSLGWALDRARRDVIIEMIFWFGFRGLLRFKKTIAAIEKQDWGTAANEMIDSQAGRNYYTRMSELAEIMRNGA